VHSQVVLPWRTCNSDGVAVLPSLYCPVLQVAPAAAVRAAAECNAAGSGAQRATHTGSSSRGLPCRCHQPRQPICSPTHLSSSSSSSSSKRSWESRRCLAQQQAKQYSGSRLSNASARPTKPLGASGTNPLGCWGGGSQGMWHGATCISTRCDQQTLAEEMGASVGQHFSEY
jgi:hypothetical protein